MDIIAYLLSRTYVKKTLKGMGALKGAACKVKTIVHQNKENIVTFEWEDTDGVKHTSEMHVEDGTPIFEYTVGDTYKYGDLVIYASAFYRCTVAEYVAEPVIDDTKFNEIGSPDGNYDIVQNASLLPVRFTPADRKMYYAVEEECFFYWDGYQWVKQGTMSQYDVMPTPASVYAGRMVQYIGATTPDYIQGYFYKCTNESGSWKWEHVETYVPELTTQQVNDLLSLLD